MDAYIAADKGEKKNKTPLEESERPLIKADFDYNETDNTFTCPAGGVPEMKKETKNGKRVYQGMLRFVRAVHSKAGVVTQEPCTCTNTDRVDA